MNILKKLGRKCVSLFRILRHKILYSISLNDIEIYCINKQFFCLIKKGATDGVARGLKKGWTGAEEFPGLFNHKATFLDIGANIGAISLYMASHGWTGFAFEASSANVDLLSRNIAVNNFNVEIISKAIHEKSGKLYFHSEGPWGMVISDSNKFITDQTEYLECICLDDWMNGKSIASIDFIKIDIEGSEPAAFRGMKNLLVKYDYPVIFCEVNLWTLGLQGETQCSLYDTIKDLGYHAYDLQNKQLVEFDIDHIPDVVCHDLYFIKNTEKVNYPVVKKEKISKEKKINQIIKQLSTYSSWSQCSYETSNVQNYDYICLALKDYPEYYNNPEIHELLKRISEMKCKYPFLEQGIAWFKNIK
jgi:FkbM family methyltransferase